MNDEFARWVRVMVCRKSVWCVCHVISVYDIVRDCQRISVQLHAYVVVKAAAWYIWCSRLCICVWCADVRLHMRYLKILVCDHGCTCMCISFSLNIYIDVCVCLLTVCLACICVYLCGCVVQAIYANV